MAIDSESHAESEDQRKYRETLQQLEIKAQESFDKIVLTLSGGALGISFAFVSDIVDASSIIWPGWLVVAWVFWGFSVTAVLSSYYFSHLALRKAVNQIDDGSLARDNPGGAYDRITAILNASGGILFLFGVIAMVVFATSNMMR